MDLRLLLLFRMGVKTPQILLVLLCTMVFVWISLYIKDLVVPVKSILQESKNINNNIELVTKYIILSFIYAIIECSTSILSFICAFFCEKFIAHWLFTEKMNMTFENFYKCTSEKQYTDFLIKKHAFVSMVTVVLFSMPSNILLFYLMCYRLLMSQNNRNLRNMAGLLSILLIYGFATYRAIYHRKKLRQKYNDARTAKNAFCRTIFDNYEVCAADMREDRNLQIFKKMSKLAAHREFTYLFLSEHYRLFIRGSILCLKLFFIFLKMGDESLAIGYIITIMNELNSNILQLRNDVFMALEYWNEVALSDSDVVKQCISRGNPKNPLAIKNGYRVVCKLTGCIIELRPNTKTFIVDSLGSEKHIFLKSLIGIKSDHYEVKLDGVEASTIEKEHMYSGVSFLSPKLYIFNKSIEFNLLYGTGLTSKQLVEKLEKFGLTEYFKQFEDGLQTIVGNKTYGLSNGQKQMICLLRCLLRDASVYIFDEPDSFLDKSTARMAYNMILSLSGKMVVVGSQTPKNMENFDQIISLS